MISLHISYLEKQPIKMSVLFLNMARMLILILQIKYDKFCWNMVKNRFHYERNRISAHTFKVWVFSNIVIDSSSTRVDSSVIDETRVGTLTTCRSTIGRPTQGFPRIRQFKNASKRIHLLSILGWDVRATSL